VSERGRWHQAIHECLAHADAKVDSLIILLTIDTPGDEPSTVTCGTNVEDVRTLIALLASHLIEAGRAVRLRVDLVPMMRPPPQG
jgi:hypothetical protein